MFHVLVSEIMPCPIITARLVAPGLVNQSGQERDLLGPGGQKHLPRRSNWRFVISKHSVTMWWALIEGCIYHRAIEICGSACVSLPPMPVYMLHLIDHAGRFSFRCYSSQNNEAGRLGKLFVSLPPACLPTCKQAQRPLMHQSHPIFFPFIHPF
jgi:hypothetical protein